MYSGRGVGWGGGVGGGWGGVCYVTIRKRLWRSSGGSWAQRCSFSLRVGLLIGEMSLSLREWMVR